MGVNRRLKDRVERIENNPATQAAAELRAARAYLGGGPVPTNPDLLEASRWALLGGAQPTADLEDIDDAIARFGSGSYLGQWNHPLPDLTPAAAALFDPVEARLIENLVHV